MMKRIAIVFGILALGGGVWFARAWSHARQNLVTLNVRNADLAKVVRSLERQTWETICAEKDLSAKITLNVRKMPLEEVLGIVSEQAGARWNSIYPLYSSSRNLARLAAALRTGEKPATNIWPNVHSQRPMAGAMFASNARSENQPVSLRLLDKDLVFATAAISRLTHSTVIADNASLSKVTVHYDATPFDQALDQLAEKSRRKWTRLYALEKMRGGGPFRPNPELAGNSERPRESREPRDRRESNDPWRNQMQELRGLPAADQDKRLADLGLSPEARQRMIAMSSLSPEERRQEMANRMSSPQAQDQRQSRMLNSIKNSTPEQRVDRFQRFQSRRRS